MPEKYVFSWRKLLLNSGLAVLLGPPHRWLYLLARDAFITVIVAGGDFSSKPFSRGIELLFMMVIYAYPIGAIPAVLAGGLHTFIRTQLPMQNVSGILLSGAVSGIFAMLFCLGIIGIFTASRLSELVTIGTVLLLIGALAGAACAYLMHWLGRQKNCKSAAYEINHGTCFRRH